VSVAKHWCPWPYLISSGSNHRSGANVYYSFIMVSSTTELQGYRNTVYRVVCDVGYQRYKIIRHFLLGISMADLHARLWWDLWVMGMSCSIKITTIIGRKKKKNRQWGEKT